MNSSEKKTPHTIEFCASNNGQISNLCKISRFCQGNAMALKNQNNFQSNFFTYL